MKTVIQLLRRKYGVTPIEFVVMGYAFYMFLMIAANAVGPSLNTNFLFSPASALDGDGVRGKH